MKKIEHIYDMTTGETTVVERDETLEEKAERELIEKEAIEAAKLKSQIESKRQAVLSKLGLTAEEVAALLS